VAEGFTPCCEYLHPVAASLFALALSLLPRCATSSRLSRCVSLHCRGLRQLSESQQRMVQLHKEKELERDRERIEAIAAGVVQIDTRQDFEEKVLHDQSDRLMVIFWGGPWCRKCTALKPEVSLLISHTPASPPPPPSQISPQIFNLNSILNNSLILPILLSTVREANGGALESTWRQNFMCLLRQQSNCEVSLPPHSRTSSFCTHTQADIPQRLTANTKKERPKDGPDTTWACECVCVCMVCDVTAGRPFQSTPAHCNDSGKKLGERKSRHHYYTQLSGGGESKQLRANRG